MSLSWIDRTRRIFVSTAGTSDNGGVQQRVRWRQSVEDVPFQDLIEVDMPKVVQNYYEAASRIDRHNRVRQGDLRL